MCVGGKEGCDGGSLGERGRESVKWQKWDWGLGIMTWFKWRYSNRLNSLNSVCV